MRDALMAIDAGLLATRQPALVNRGGTRALAREVHRPEAMTVAALEGVVRFHALPLVLRKREAPVQKLLACVDGAGELSPQLARGLHLASDLVREVVRHMAIRTRGADT